MWWKNIIFNEIFQYERGLSPYRREPGDCGVMVVYAEEKSGLKDKVETSDCISFSGNVH